MSSVSAQELIAVFGKLSTPQEVNQAKALLNHRLAEIGQQEMKRAVERGVAPGASVEVLVGTSWKPGIVEGVHAQTATIRVPGVDQKRFPPTSIRVVKN